MIPIHLSAHWPGPWRESWNTGNHQPAGRLSILRKAELSQSWQWCSNLQNLTSAKLWATTWQRQVHMPLHMQACHAIWQSQWASWFVSHMISLLLIELEAFWVPFVCLCSPFSEPSCAKLLDRRPSPQVGNEANCLLGLYALSMTNGARAAPLLDSNLTEPDLICSRCCVGCDTGCSFLVAMPAQPICYLACCGPWKKERMPAHSPVTISSENMVLVGSNGVVSRPATLHSLSYKKVPGRNE